MRIKVDSLTPRIVELRRQGMRNCEIARALGCSEVNVHKALKRAEMGSVVPIPKSMRIAHIGLDEYTWLVQEAGRSNVRWQDLARALLVDAIVEARDGKG